MKLFRFVALITREMRSRLPNGRRRSEQCPGGRSAAQAAGDMLESFIKPKRLRGKIKALRVMVEDSDWGAMCTGLVRVGVRAPN